MKRLSKFVLGAVFSFMFCFMCIGYAEVSTTLFVNGSVEVSAPKGVFITNVELYSASATSRNVSFFYPTNVDSTINGAHNSTVTYKITVFNNTAYKYAYAGIAYEEALDGYNGNQYIGNGITITTKENPTDQSATFNTRDSIEAGKTITFYATYTISGSRAASIDLKTLINYKFGVHVDSMGAVAIDSALSKFEDILNDMTAGGGYETLISKIDDKYDGKNDWKANYIGNVVDSSSADTETVNDLFEGELSLIINNVETNVTVLIKREDVDGNINTGDSYTASYGDKTTSAAGCEMTLYMTTDKLQRGTPVIYAAVFTCDKNADGTYGNWYMIGDMYVGTASIVGYEGGQSTGSFDTGTWRSSAGTYNVSDDYSYTIASGSTIQAIVQATDAKANATLQELLTVANDLLNGQYGSFAGDAMVELEEVFVEAARSYTENADGSVTVNDNVTRAQLVPLIKQLEAALAPFKSIVGN